MPAQNEDLHGQVPDTSPVALLLVDVINDLEFPGADQLYEQALTAARHIAALKARAKRQQIPVVYVNDNFGLWQSDLHRLIEHGLRDQVRGKPIVGLLRPDDDDYFVLKPKYSGFFGTTLDTLLAYLQAKTLIICGLTGDRCVLFTANDAFMRDFRLIVPSDCVASIDPKKNEQVLAYLHTVLGLDTTPSAELDLDALKHAQEQPSM